MRGPLDHILSGRGFPELVVLTTDSHSGAVTGAVSLGENWDHILRDLVLDAGRQAQSEPSA